MLGTTEGSMPTSTKSTNAHRGCLRGLAVPDLLGCRQAGRMLAVQEACLLHQACTTTFTADALTAPLNQCHTSRCTHIQPRASGGCLL